MRIVKEQAMTINSWWNKNSKREKILVMVTVPLVIIILAQLLLLQPLEKKQKDVATKIQSMGLELDKVSQQIETTEQLLAVSSKVKLGNQQQSLQEQVLKQKELLSELTDNLIPPEKMAIVVEKLLKQRGKLKLISLANLEPEGLPNVEAEIVNTIDKNDSVEESKPLIYRHPLQLKFKGSYFQVVKYLKTLENSEYNFYWEQLDYKVDKYPQAEVMLKLSTLGTKSQWMGVGSNDE